MTVDDSIMVLDDSMVVLGDSMVVLCDSVVVLGDSIEVLGGFGWFYVGRMLVLWARGGADTSRLDLSGSERIWVDLGENGRMAYVWGAYGGGL